MAKLRVFAEGCVAIAPRMKLKWLVCKLPETKVLISHNVNALHSGRSMTPWSGFLSTALLTGARASWRSMPQNEASRHWKKLLPRPDYQGQHHRRRKFGTAICETRSLWLLRPWDRSWALSAEGTSSNRPFRVRRQANSLGWGNFCGIKRKYFVIAFRLNTYKSLTPPMRGSYRLFSAVFQREILRGVNAQKRSNEALLASHVTQRFWDGFAPFPWIFRRDLNPVAFKYWASTKQVWSLEPRFLGLLGNLGL